MRKRFYVRKQRGGTPTYQSGASDYGWARGTTTTGAVGTGSGDNADAQIVLTSTTGTGANEDLSAEIVIYDPSNTGFNTLVTYDVFHRTSDAAARVIHGGGQYLADTAVTAIRYLMSSGNIASGEFRLYGLRDA